MMDDRTAAATSSPVVVAFEAPSGGGAAPDCATQAILLVSWYFPPTNTVAAIRLGKMARYLERAGHRLRVVTPDLQSADPSLAVEISSAAVTRTRYWDLDRRLNPTSRNAGDAGPPGPAGRAAWWARMRLEGRRGLGRLYRDIVLYPDQRIDWSFTLLPTLIREIRKERPDLIIVSGPPFSSFIATAIAARWFDIPWIAEFRDRWVDDPYGARPRWRARVDQGLEALLVAQAAGIVTVSDIWSRFYAGKYGLPTETVMNGYDPKDFALDLDPPADLPVRLLHAGTIYPGRRDPAALFEALRRRDFSPDEIRVQFYGRELRTIEEQARRQGVEAFVDFAAAVPYRQAIELQKRADLLLLLQWNDPADEGNVPAKIFEYFATNRQILGLGPVNGVPARLVTARQAGIFCNDPDEIAGRLQDWIEEKRATGRVAPPSSAASDGLDRDGQYRRLESFCQAVIAEERDRRACTRARRPKALAGVLQSRHFAAVDRPADARPVLAVIIDTEADFDWRAPFTRNDHSTRSVLQQSRAQGLFERFGFKPTYLIDYPVATDPTACRVLRRFVDHGAADIGIQLHPWTNPPFDELLSARNSYPSNLPKALQSAKIERLIEAVRRNLEIEPKVFKAGRYGFNDDTADLLETFGLDIDTSVVPFTDFGAVHGPNFQGCPQGPFWFGRRRPLLELPVTRTLCGPLGRRIGPWLLPMIQSRPGLTCHLPGILARSRLLDRLTLTPEGMGLDDLKRLTGTLIKRGERVFTFVFHSPSLDIGNTPYVQSEADLQGFIRRIEAYLRFFKDELGGEGLSAIEVRHRLLAHGGGPADGTGSRQLDLDRKSPAEAVRTTAGKAKQPASIESSFD